MAMVVFVLVVMVLIVVGVGGCGGNLMVVAGVPMVIEHYNNRRNDERDYGGVNGGDNG